MSKNIIFKDKSTGKIINSSLIDKTKINEGISKELIEVEDTGDSYIIYLDANNLYGYSMIQHMPTSNFKWNYKHDNEELNKEKQTKERILKLGDRDSTGYLFDVNISYISDDKNKTEKENEELTKQLHDHVQKIFQLKMSI